MDRLRKMTNYSTENLVLMGFLTAYLLFFVHPIFLNENNVMAFPEYVPKGHITGVDLEYLLSYSEAWFINHTTPYIVDKNPYPPFAVAFFAPLLLLDFSTAYQVVSLVIVLGYIVVTLLIPAACEWKKKESGGLLLIVFLFATGLYSYGFQFEVERGQDNIIAFLFCMLAVYIYHYQHKYRYLAYFLFTISVQLKVFPLIFIILFVEDYRDWKGNIKRFTGLAILNFIFLFVLGWQNFLDFLVSIKSTAQNPYIWIGNHSMTSFLSGLGERLVRGGYGDWFADNSGLIGLLLFFVVLFNIFIILLYIYKYNAKGLNSFLLLACTVGALIIPSVSHDYKLSILAGPMAIFLSRMRLTDSKIPLLSATLVTGVAFLYSSTLFSYAGKETYFLQNNFPALMFLLLSVTCLYALKKDKVDS